MKRWRAMRRDGGLRTTCVQCRRRWEFSKANPSRPLRAPAQPIGARWRRCRFGAAEFACGRECREAHAGSRKANSPVRVRVGGIWFRGGMRPGRSFGQSRRSNVAGVVRIFLPCNAAERGSSSVYGRYFRGAQQA